MSSINAVNFASFMWLVFALVYLFIWRDSMAGFFSKLKYIGNIGIFWILNVAASFILAGVLRGHLPILAGNNTLEFEQQKLYIWPISLIFVLLSLVVAFWLVMARYLAKSAFYACGILNIILLIIPGYLYTIGMNWISGILVCCNFGAILIVHVLNEAEDPDIFVREIRRLVVLLPIIWGSLRLGVVVAGIWLYVSFSQLQIPFEWFSKLVYVINIFRDQEFRSYVQVLLVVGNALTITMGCILFQNLIMFLFSSYSFIGKSRFCLAIFLYTFPMELPLLLWEREQSVYLSTILLTAGIIIGFLLLGLVPKDSERENIMSIPIYTFFYGSTFGMVCLVSNGIKDAVGIITFQLFVLLVGIVLGLNIRSLISQQDLKDTYV